MRMARLRSRRMMGCEGFGAVVVTHYTVRNEYDDFGRYGKRQKRDAKYPFAIGRSCHNGKFNLCIRDRHRSTLFIIIVCLVIIH